MEKGYNLIQTADLLGIKVRTVRDWIHKGQLKAHKMNGSRKWVVLESEIKRLRGESDANEN